MPRKIRSGSRAVSRKMSRGEIVLFVVSAIVALSMIFGTIFAALVR